jgi:Flp pilus assembly pilin Flp
MHNMFLKNELQTRMLLDFRVLGRMNIPRGMANDPYRQPKDGGALKIFSKKDFYRREVKNNMINKVITRAKIALRRLKSKKGQTLVEYALILAFIAVVAISVLLALGQTVRGVFSTINSQLQLAQSSH